MGLGLGFGLGMGSSPALSGVVGYQHVRLNVTLTNGGNTFGAVEIELAATAGGTNVLTGKTYTFSHINGPDPDDGGNFNSLALFDAANTRIGVVGDNAVDTPSTTNWAQVNLGAPVAIAAGWNLRIRSEDGFPTQHPKNFQLWLSNDPTMATKVVALSVTGAIPGNTGAGTFNNDYTLTAP